MPSRSAALAARPAGHGTTSFLRRFAIAAAVILQAPWLVAAPPWLEVKSAHFTVITNSGEKQGRRVAWQFEQIRAALVRLWPWAQIDKGRPFVVFAVRDEDTLRTLGPQYWEGKRYRPTSFWVSSRDRNFIALRTDVQEPDEIGANPYQSAYWSYTSSVFSRSFPRPLPAWYSRGIADVMSNTIVRENELHVGRPIRDRVELLRQRMPVRLDELLTVDGRSHWRTQEEDARYFDAEAWALVHYLLFADKAAHLPKVDRFNRLLVEGRDAEAALREAFGPMEPYFDGMRLYVTRSVFTYSRVPVSLDTRAETYASRPLSAGETAALRGELLVAMDRPAEARAFAAEAAKADPSLPGPWEIEAALLDAEDRRDDARAAFVKAAAAGSTRAEVYYRLAQLEWTASADKAALERLADRLEKARSLEPERANTLSFLAEVRTHLGQGEEGVGLARRAVEIEPAEAYHRLALAGALWALKRPEEAVRAARAAQQAADSEEERQRVQSFMDFATRAVATKPAVSASPRADPAVVSASPPAAPAAVVPVADVIERIRVTVDPKAADAMAACFDKRDEAACRRAGTTLQRYCSEKVEDACIGWALLQSRPR